MKTKIQKHFYGYKKDKEDLRDHHYSPKSFLSVKQLPKKVDLRPFCSPIVDQGNLGSCTANAIASGLREFLEIQSGKGLTFLSRLFLYYEERKIEGSINSDSGAMIRDGMKVLQKIGVCPESEEPYNISKFKQAPTTQEITDAAQFKITSYHRIKDINLLKASLAENKPVVCGIDVYSSFESASAAKTGMIPMPKKGESLLGGHAVLAVGYDDKKGYVIMRNSWGTGWGDKGYFYMPYPVFVKLTTDMWSGE